jgi:NAD(P)H dehydrogenase (quinone)
MNKKVLITGANGDTGRAAVRESIALGLDVRAMAHKKDARSEPLEKLGAEIVGGDLLEIDTVRAAMEGVDAAYFVWPVQPDLIPAVVNFIQAAKESGVKIAINLSQRSANRDSTSHSCRDSFIAEQVFNWSGLSVIHLRPTYFLEWLLYPWQLPFLQKGDPAHPGGQGTAFAYRRG